MTTVHERPRQTSRRRRPVVAGVLLAAALVLLPAAPVSAHVLIESAEPLGDGVTVLTFVFDHGCEDGEATDRLRVELPDGVEAVAAQQPSGWSVELGDDVRWHGDAIEDNVRAELGLEVRVTGSVGQTFVFPTEQGCVGGAAYEWVDPDPSSAYPAPSFVATTATLASVVAPAGAATPSDVAAPVATVPLVAGVLLVSVGVGSLGAWWVRRQRPTGR